MSGEQALMLTGIDLKTHNQGLEGNVKYQVITTGGAQNLQIFEIKVDFFYRERVATVAEIDPAIRRALAKLLDPDGNA